MCALGINDAHTPEVWVDRQAGHGRQLSLWSEKEKGGSQGPFMPSPIHTPGVLRGRGDDLFPSTRGQITTHVPPLLFF